MSTPPWYENGLRFECSQCGDCCTGAPGWVWVNKKEIAAIAAEIGQDDIAQFEKDFVRDVGVRKSLKEFDNGDCVFFDSQARNCKVYHARPRQCRSWPFWDSNIKSEKAWQATCRACPGSGTGKLYQLEDIEEHRKQIRI